MTKIRDMIKNTLFILLMFLSGTLMADEFNKDRYKGYKFSPHYTDDRDISENASKIINKYLADWRYLRKLKGISIWQDKIIVSYIAGLNKKYYSEWHQYRKNRLSKKLSYEPALWSAISVFGGTKHTKDLNKKINGLFPNGHFANDYYGCIELKPLFTASLIEGNPDALFSITGIGDIMSNSILDRLTLNVYDDNLRSIIQENLFLANYNPYVVKQSKYKFNYYTASNELPEIHPLVESNVDHRGRKKYAKLFVSDFDHNGLLEIIFWHRQYYSTLISDKKNNGFVFEKQWFTYYAEEKKSKNIIRKNISTDKAINLLNKNELKWKDGFPENNSICKEKGHSPYPMMPLIIDNEI